MYRENNYTFLLFYNNCTQQYRSHLFFLRGSQVIWLTELDHRYIVRDRHRLSFIRLFNRICWLNRNVQDQYKFIYDTLEEYCRGIDSRFPVSELANKIKEKTVKDQKLKKNAYALEYAVRPGCGWFEFHPVFVKKQLSFPKRNQPTRSQALICTLHINLWIVLSAPLHPSLSS